MKDRELIAESLFDGDEIDRIKNKYLDQIVLFLEFCGDPSGVGLSDKQKRNLKEFYYIFQFVKQDELPEFKISSEEMNLQKEKIGEVLDYLKSIYESHEKKWIEGERQFKLQEDYYKPLYQAQKHLKKSHQYTQRLDMKGKGAQPPRYFYSVFDRISEYLLQEMVNGWRDRKESVNLPSFEIFNKGLFDSLPKVGPATLTVLTLISNYLECLEGIENRKARTLLERLKERSPTEFEILKSMNRTMVHNQFDANGHEPAKCING